MPKVKHYHNSMFKAVFAVDRNGGIGLDNHLPWPHDSEDLKHFKNLTHGHIVVMGRKTWDSFGPKKPLPNRMNVVVTRCPCWGEDPKNVPDGTIAPSDFHDALILLAETYPNQDVWFIGGSQLLTLAKPYIREIFLTVFNDSYECDTVIDVNAYLDGFEHKSTDTRTNKNFQHWTRTTA